MLRLRRLLSLTLAACLGLPALAATAGPAAAATPSAPTALRVSPGPYTAALSWAAPTTAPTAVTGYRLSLTPAVATDTVPVPATVPAAVHAWTLDGLRPGHRYTVAVTALAGSTSAGTASAGTIAPTPGGQLTAVSGALLDRAALAPATATTVQVSGKDGVPTAGVAAALLRVRASAGTGPVTVSLAPAGGTAQTALTLAAGESAGTTLALPLPTSGAVSVTASAAATVSVDVTGWVSTPAAAGAAAAGTFVPLAPQVVLDTGAESPGRLKVGAPRTVSVVDATSSAGTGSKTNLAPATATAALVEVTTAGALDPGQLSVAPAGTGAVPPVLPFSAGEPDTTQALVPLAGGQLVVSATVEVDVRVRLLGYVAGTEATSSTDYVTVTAPTPLVAASAPAEGATLTAVVAGKAGAPAASATAPPTAALVRVCATAGTDPAAVALAETKDALVTADPAVRVPAGRTATALVRVPLAADGSFQVSTGGSPATVRVDLVGFTVGGIVRSARDKALDAATAPKASAPSATGVVTLPLTAQARTVSVGDVLTSGPTAANPKGLLRVVTGSPVVGATTVAVPTRDAGMAEAYPRLSLAFNQPARRPSAAGRTAALRTMARSGYSTPRAGLAGAARALDSTQVDLPEVSVPFQGQWPDSTGTTVDPTVKLSGSLTLDLAFTGRVDYDMFPQPWAEAEVVATGTTTLHANVTLNSRDSGVSADIPIPGEEEAFAEINEQEIPAGPVLLSPHVGTSLSVGVSGKFGASYDVTRTDRVSVGGRLRVSAGGAPQFTPIATHDASSVPSLTGPTGEGTASVAYSLTVGVAAEHHLVYLALAQRAALVLSVTPTESPSWALKFGLPVDLVVGVDPFEDTPWHFLSAEQTLKTWNPWGGPWTLMDSTGVSTSDDLVGHSRTFWLPESGTGPDTTLAFEGKQGQSLGIYLDDPHLPGNDYQAATAELTYGGEGLDGEHDVPLGGHEVATLPEDGKYVLTVHNAAGPARPVTLTVSPAVEASELRVGDPGIAQTANLTEPGQAVHAQVFLTAGQQVSAAAFNAEGIDPRLDVTGPDGLWVGQDGVGPSQRWTAQATGTYTVWAYADDPASTGRVSLRVSTDKVASTAVDATPITLSRAQGQGAQVTFTAAAGSNIGVAAWGAGQSFTLHLLDAQGAAQADGAASAQTQGSLQAHLDIAGTYTIMLEPAGVTDLGDKVTIRVSSDLVVPATVDGPSVSPRTVEGQQARVTFAGTAGTEVSAAEILSPGSAYTTTALLDPRGRVIASSDYYDTKVMGPTTLPTNGTYTLLVTPVPESADPSATVVYLTAVHHGTASVDGPAVTASLAVGQGEDVSFAGAAGQVVTVGAPTDLPLNYTLLGPDGGVVASAAFGSVWLRATLPSTGIYRLRGLPEGVVYPSPGHALVQISTDKTITTGVNAAATALSWAPGQPVTVRVPVVKGVPVVASVYGVTAESIQVTVTGPDGTVLRSGFDWADTAVTFTPTTTGTATVSFAPYGSDSAEAGRAGVQFSTASTSALAVNGSASTTVPAGQRRSFTVTLHKGPAAAVVSGLTSSTVGVQVKVTGPGGTSVASSTESSPSDGVVASFSAPADGTYTVTLSSVVVAPFPATVAVRTATAGVLRYGASATWTAYPAGRPVAATVLVPAGRTVRLSLTRGTLPGDVDVELLSGSRVLATATVYAAARSNWAGVTVGGGTYTVLLRPRTARVGSVTVALGTY